PAGTVTSEPSASRRRGRMAKSRSSAAAPSRWTSRTAAPIWTSVYPSSGSLRKSTSRASCWRTARRLSASLRPGAAAAARGAGGADQRQVRERLGEVAEVLRLGAQLLAVQAQVIGVAEHLLEEEPRLLEVPHAGEALDVPEGAHREGAFLPREPVGEPAGEAI